ncbi:MAG: protealysin inhibitor emfourin [Thermodesulfobacteriota bacterium]
MRVRFQQSGGYAGLIKGCDFDTESLPPEEARVLNSLVKKSNIKGNQKFITRDARDLRTYSITIEKNEESNSISFDDMSVPKEVEELLSFLESRAKPQSPK